MKIIDLQRREFIKGSLAASLAAGVWLSNPFRGSLSASAFAADSAFSDDKSLVCIFLSGGNDSFNMVVPASQTGYAVYQSTRQNLAVAKDSLLSVHPRNSLDESYGFNPAIAPLHQLFEEEKLALINNIGTLIQPVTKDEVEQGSVDLPPQLFSHNDQQRHWQTAWPQSQQVTGWGGRIADLIADNSALLPMNITLAGTNYLQTGTHKSAYALSPEGAAVVEAMNSDYEGNRRRLAVFESLLAQSSHLMAREYGETVIRAMDIANLVNSALEFAPDLSTFFSARNNLTKQLAMVARMISIEERLPQKRSIYFVEMGGWDTHDNQLQAHPQLLASLAQAMSDFYSALDSIDKTETVTTFTMSEFGRTMTSNGDGTDHGWGGIQMVMGGAVQGKQFYGKMPDLNLGSEDDAADGRIIPTTSVDQYAATLAGWLGLSTSQLLDIFPNLSNFAEKDLGFMAL